jgi:glycine cleavage system H protein
MAEYRGCVLPEDLFYDLDYVWFRRVLIGRVTIGVTDPAQTMAGRVQAVHIKKVGTEIRPGRHVATVESGKWVGGIPVPFAATVVERNEAVLAEPQLDHRGSRDRGVTAVDRSLRRGVHALFRLGAARVRGSPN